MKCILLLAICLGIVALASVSEANPQRVYVQKLPYYPPPTRAPRPIRVRRDAADNARQVESSIRIGKTNTLSSKVAKSDTESFAAVGLRNDAGIGAEFNHHLKPGTGETFTKALTYDYTNGDHTFGSRLFQSNVNQDNGLKYDATGGKLGYSHTSGHGLDASLTRFSGFGKQGSLDGKYNLFTSDDGHLKVNANAGTSRWLSGPLSGQNDHRFGLGVSYNGWGR